MRGIFDTGSRSIPQNRVAVGLYKIIWPRHTTFAPINTENQPFSQHLPLASTALRRGQLITYPSLGREGFLNPYWSRSSHQPSRRSEVLRVITFGTLRAEFDIELRENSNLVFRFESPRGRDVFLSRPQSQDAEVSSATQCNINKFTPRPSSADELARPAFTEGRS
ncbi:hypothetical protein ACFX15_044252 [Malus domestica]